MKRLVFDIEGNGLLFHITHIWCICTEDIDTGERRSYPPERLFAGIKALQSADVLIGHNIIGYDLPAIWKITDPWEHTPLITDTLITSRALFPERPGGHALEAWGERLGVPKIKFDEYDKYTPEMLEYCEGDVATNVALYHELNREMEEAHGVALEGYKVYP